MKNNKTDIVIIIICCLLIAACAAFFIWKLIPKSESTADATDTSADSTFVPDVEYDEDFIFDFAGEDLTKYIILGEYKGVSVTTTVTERTVKDIQSDIDQVLSMFSTVNKITDREIAYGDVICANIVMLTDGEVVSGTEDTEVLVEIDTDETNVIAPFIVGHTPGETVLVDITADIKEKSGSSSDIITNAEKIEYKFEILYIREEIKQEITHEFCREKLGYDTYDEFVEAYRIKASAEYALSNDENLYYNILDAVYANCTVVSVPQDYADNMFNYYKYQYEVYANYYGIDYATFMSLYVGLTEDELREEINASVMQEIMLYAIAKEQDLLADDEDIRKYAESVCDDYDMTADEFIEQYTKAAIEEYLTTENASDYIVDHAVITYAVADATATTDNTEE